MAKVRLITHKGRTDTMMGWAKSIGLSNVTLRMRLDSGWSVKRSLETPVQPRRKSKPRKPKLILPLRTYQHANVTRGMRETTDVQSAVRGDTSKDTSAKAIAESSDQFDRASEAIAKHTARLEADAQAVGLGVSALEELRAKSALLTAAQQAGLPVNDALIAKINALAKAAGEAGDKLAKAKINGQISFGRQTALLSPEDTAIAAQLKGQFGDDVPRALASSEAAALRLNSALKEVSTSISGSLVTGFTDMLDGTKSVSQGFSDMSRTIIRALEEAVVRMMIVAPIMKGLQALLGFSDGGIVGGSPLAGAANFIGPVLKADGGMFLISFG